MQELLKKSKLNKTETKKAVTILTEGYNKDGNIDELCNYLMKLPANVTEEFFIENYSLFENSDKLKLFVDTMINNSKFIENTTSASVRRAVEIINIYLKKQNYNENICVLFNSMLKVSLKKYTVSKTFIDIFEKRIINNTKFSFFNLNSINDDTIYELFLVDALVEKGILNENSNELKNWYLYDRYVVGDHKNIKPTKSKQTKTSQNSSINELELKIDKITQNENDLILIVKDLQNKMDKIAQKLDVDVNVIENNNLNNNSNDNIDIAKLKEELAKEKEKSADLDRRLTVSYEIDQTANSQEVITLKNDIADGLKLEHKNYKENLDEPCNEDNFLAYRATVMRIFRTLKRFGVEFE